jgi:tol-pal system protein YbgF
VENLGQSQDSSGDGGAQTGALVSAPAPMPATQDNTMQQQPPAPGQTDNTPLVSQSSVAVNNNPIAQNNPGVSLSTLPIPDRVAHLEQQMQNLVQVNMPDQITNLQQQVQQLSGELQVQQHDIALLNQQLRNFYQDLAAQIKQGKNISAAPVTADDSAPVSSNSDVTANASSTPDTSSAPTAAVTVTDKYKTALNLLTQKKYPEALKTFQAYLKASPKGHFAASAHYWLGEIYVQMKNLGAASVEYRRVVQNFPHSDKVADAEVKLAIIHVSEGKTVQARAEFTKIKQEYPGTTASQLADIQLQQLGTQ